MSTVVDASVAVMWFVTEQHSQNALRLLAAEYDLHAPDLIQAEVASAMLKAVRRKWIGLDKARRSIEEMCAAPVRLYRATEHIEGAFRIAQRQGGSLYDAIYISLARSLQAPLVTDDIRLAAVAKGAGVRAWLIADGVPPPGR